MRDFQWSPAHERKGRTTGLGLNPCRACRWRFLPYWRSCPACSPAGARAGWEMPAFAVAQVGRHAALMIAVFFGTVIGLERAVALGRLWPHFAPLFAGLAGLAMLAWLPPMWAPRTSHRGGIGVRAATCGCW